MRCAACSAEAPDSGRFCPSCGAVLGGSAAETVLADDATKLASPGRSGVKSGSSGWLTSSGSIDHGRFPPGTVLDGRYRIIGLLGRGGMGEVYRADDLRLGQPVALKFLPEDLGRDPMRLAQFHNEVRTARQVSHPNVCRMYDVGEVEGLLYLTMEYVDGEDLATSLRRIGRFPEDKALDIARQLAAGLAAAHDRGVLHRDLKPANVMLDGSGKVRIMDFSLASVGEVENVRAGTPAYMAPEQLQGREVTARSDIFALGLILYELFTGRRAFSAVSIADLVQQHESGDITAVGEIVKSIDPAIDRAIRRCLEHEPSRRPSSALAVSAALPGGDPLAAALAAGETPSPEMVAAAGGEGAAISAGAGAAWLAATIVLLGVIAAVQDRVTIPGRMPLERPVAVLLDRAQELRRALGYTEPVADQAHGLRYDADFLNWAVRNGSGARGWAELATGRPAPMFFWHRTSPLVMQPFGLTASPGLSDPPLLVAGMTSAFLDMQGRLLQFYAVPPQVDPPPMNAPSEPAWEVLFEWAGLDRTAFVESPPAWLPRMHADVRRAWQGPLSGSDHTVRIEAAAFRGRVVSFEIVGEWSRPTRQVEFTPAEIGRLTNVAGSLIIAILPIGAAWLARRNLKTGRADRSGAMRLTLFAFLLMMIDWALGDHLPILGAEVNLMFGAMGIALFNGAVLGVVYLALEPFIRRHSPEMLITWTRAIGGRLTDPRVGRDVLLGAACGCAVSALALLYNVLPSQLGYPEPIPNVVDLAPLVQSRALISGVVARVNWALQNGFFGTLVFALLRHALQLGLKGVSRSVVTGMAGALSVLVFALVSSRGATLETGYLLFDLAFQALVVLVFLLVILRLGLFAAAVAFYANLLTSGLLVTLDPAKLYATQSWLLLAIVAGLASLGFWLARGGDARLRPGRRSPHAIGQPGQ